MAVWKLKYENWQRANSDLAGLPPPEKPERPAKGPVPFWLNLYLECQRWNIPLCEGGLVDQPDWSWDLMNLAGTVYLEVMAHG